MKRAIRINKIVIAAASCCLLILCAGDRTDAGSPIDSAAESLTASTVESLTASAVGYTDEYRAFIVARRNAEATVENDSSGGYRFALKNGRLRVFGADDAVIWRTKGEWYIDSFRLGDVNGDQILDVTFIVWKSYSFGFEHPARIANEDAAVRCHIFVYSIKDDKVKPLWCSSNLPRAVYSFELNADGERTPTLSGMRMKTREGAYTENFGESASAEYVYEWNSWGFSPVQTPGASGATGDGDGYYATLAVVGDLMCHEAQNRDAFAKGGGSAYDYNYAFKHIAPHISAADYAIGNLETTIIKDGGAPSGYPLFGSPAAYAEAVKAAGFDFVSTANNHSLDYRKDGLERTLQVLDELGLEHTGTYLTEADSLEITIVDVNGISFAILSYTYGTNGIPSPRDMPWCINRAEDIHDGIARAKALNPDVIIVMPHIGEEYETTTRQIYKDEVYKLFQAGADVVLASHPHVLQQAEFVAVADAEGFERNCFAAYSLGNFISSQRTAPRDYGMIANLNFKKSAGGKAELDSVSLTPTWVKYMSADGHYDITILPVNELDKPEFAGVAEGLRPADVRRIDEVKREFASMFPDFSIF